MNTDENRERENILRLQQFVLNNQSEDIRNELYDYIIIRTIYDHGESQKTLKQESILTYIENDYGITGMPDSIIPKSIARLKKKKSIQITNENIELESKTIDEIKNNNLDFVELIKNIKNDLETEITDKLNISTMQSQEITEEFFKLLGKVFSTGGRTASKIIMNSRDNSELLDNNDFKNNYQKLILSKIKSEQHEILNEIFKDFFSNNTKEYNKFFFTLIQSYALLEVFNIDPTLKQIQENALKQKKIYLDTNILIPLLFEASEIHEIVKSALQITEQLGAQLLITNATKMEFERWIESCRISYISFRNIPEKFIEAFKKNNTNAPFFNTYRKRALENFRLSINEFCKYYENYLVIIKDKFNIELESEKLDSLTEDENYDDLLNYILRITPEKGKHVASHDALNILNVKQKRTETNVDELGQPSWFLTTDTSLKKIEKKIFPDDEFRASIRINIWLQVISPVVSPKLRENNDGSKAFAKLLSMNFNSSNVVSDEDILNILSAFIEDNEITVDSLKVIVGNTHIRESFRKIRQSHREQNTEEQEKWEKIGISQISNTLHAEHKAETTDLNKVIKNFSTELEHQKQEMKEHKKVIQTQTGILKQQSVDLKKLQKEKNEADWSKKFIKKLGIAIAIGVIIIIAIIIVTDYFNLILDNGSLLGIISIEATVLGVIFGTWFAIHKTKFHTN